MTIEEAAAKIDQEAEKLGGQYAQLIASHIIEHELLSAENAEKVKDKTLKACVEQVKSKAKKQAQGNVAVVEDAQVWSWVRDFYGFEDATPSKIVDLFDLL